MSSTICSFFCSSFIFVIHSRSYVLRAALRHCWGCYHYWWDMTMLLSPWYSLIYFNYQVTPPGLQCQAINLGTGMLYISSLLSCLIIVYSPHSHYGLFIVCFIQLVITGTSSRGTVWIYEIFIIQRATGCSGGELLQMFFFDRGRWY